MDLMQQYMAQQNQQQQPSYNPNLGMSVSPQSVQASLIDYYAALQQAMNPQPAQQQPSETNSGNTTNNFTMAAPTTPTTPSTPSAPVAQTPSTPAAPATPAAPKGQSFNGSQATGTGFAPVNYGAGGAAGNLSSWMTSNGSWS